MFEIKFKKMLTTPESYDLVVAAQLLDDCVLGNKDQWILIGGRNDRRSVLPAKMAGPFDSTGYVEVGGMAIYRHDIGLKLVDGNHVYEPVEDKLEGLNER